jgi:hypothetical protein
MGGIYECAVVMGAGGMICIPSFMKTGAGIQKLLGWEINMQTHRQQGDLINLLFFFQKKGRRLKMRCEILVCKWAKAWKSAIQTLTELLVFLSLSSHPEGI